jgi:hypothetical protein
MTRTNVANMTTFDKSISETANESTFQLKNLSLSRETISTAADEHVLTLTDIAARHHIYRGFVARLQQLEHHEIIFICDDSGSMATAVGQ